MHALRFGFRGAVLRAMRSAVTWALFPSGGPTESEHFTTTPYVIGHVMWPHVLTVTAFWLFPALLLLFSTSPDGLLAEVIARLVFGAMRAITLFGSGISLAVTRAAAAG